MSKALVEIKNLSVGYDTTAVLEDINLEIFEHDFIGIIGPNGGGKSTLIKSILDVVPHWKGELHLNIPADKIGYLPQFNPFDKAFPISVLDVVLSGLSGKKGLFKKYTSSDIEVAEGLMQQAGIMELRNKAIGELSGGQTQRTLLCRALMNKPELLILDEPSTFVDNQFESELFEWLNELNKNIAILMVSHDVGTISSHVKTIACVNHHLHYHPSNTITAEQLANYNCPIQVISHGEIPHQVLAKHKH